MGHELKPEIITRLATLAAAEGMSVDDYVQSLLDKESEIGTANRELRHRAQETILELQKKVKPDPEGWTIRDYINHGRL